MNGNSISLVVPAYNEEKRIVKVLTSFANHFYGQEIIVVCNGCTDDTAGKVRELGLELRNIKCLEFKEKLGKGGAVIQGLKVATGDIIGFVDADESTMPEDIGRMLNAMSNADGIIASRRLAGAIILVKQPLLEELPVRCSILLSG
jgi:glycosyltransferase involved in cell wall biosynthesis